MIAEKDRLLLIFAKNVEPGHVKTRLAEVVGDEQAVRIYRKLLRYTQRITSEIPVDRQIWYDQNIPDDSYFPQSHYTPRLQRGKGLGERMKNAFQQAFQDGYQQVVIIGTDCPQLTVPILQQAYKQLQKHDVVIGPAKDGGYYLLGMNRLYVDLFENKKWSTNEVYEQTINVLKKAGIDWFDLEILQDVDRWEDWLETREKLNKKDLDVGEA